MLALASRVCVLSCLLLLSVAPASARPHPSAEAHHVKAHHHVQPAHRAQARHGGRIHRTSRAHRRHAAMRMHRHAHRHHAPGAYHRHAHAGSHRQHAKRRHGVRLLRRHTVHRGQAAAEQRPAPSPIAGLGAAFAGEVRSALVSEARRFIGTNPTGRRSLWCARFMNLVLRRTGRQGTGSDMARSFASYGKRISGPRIGAIAVLSRGKRGGHVGVISGLDRRGNPIIVSGNHGRRVGEAAYPRNRVIAYVMP